MRSLKRQGGWIAAPMLGLRPASGVAPFTCDAADFDGTNDWMARGGALTGIADGKAGTFACCFRVDGGDGTFRGLYIINTTTAAAGFSVFLDSSNRLNVIARNTAGTLILNKITTSTYAAGATWYVMEASWDLAATTSHLYVNDAAPTLGTNTNTDDTIDYTKDNVGIAARGDGATKFSGCLAEVFFHTTYIDLSVEANRRKFISATGKPVSLGADGSTPLGVQPLVYQRIADGAAASTFATNLGSGGNFTITGTLDVCSTSPTD